MISKKKLLAKTGTKLIKSQRKSFIHILDQALRHVDAGEEAKAKRCIDQADALWNKVAKVHGVKL